MISLRIRYEPAGREAGSVTVWGSPATRQTTGQIRARVVGREAEHTEISLEPCATTSSLLPGFVDFDPLGADSLVRGAVVVGAGRDVAHEWPDLVRPIAAVARDPLERPISTMTKIASTFTHVNLDFGAGGGISNLGSNLGALTTREVLRGEVFDRADVADLANGTVDGALVGRGAGVGLAANDNLADETVGRNKRWEE